MQFFRRARNPRSMAIDTNDAAWTRRRLRLLLVDENPTARAVVARRLSHLNYDVTLAENGFVGINLLVTQPADIILVDMGLTLLPAITTLRKMKAVHPTGNASFVTVAGRQDKLSMAEALDAGADDHIVKPFDFDLLDIRLRHLRQQADRLDDLSRHNAELDARIARRAVELGETRESLREMQADRARLVSSIAALRDEITRLQGVEHQGRDL